MTNKTHSSYRNKILSLISIFFAFNSFIFSQKTSIYFDHNSCQITPKSKLIIDSISNEIKNVKSQEEIALVGFTDADGNAEYNDNLSLQRALAVKKVLIENNITNQIHILSKGESAQINANSTEQEKLLNRRVEIQRNFSRNNAVYGSFKKTPQVFKIKPNCDTVLICKEGTSININRNSFETKNQKSTITINVQEFYSKKDFVLANLTTLDVNDKLLESRGMINIEVTQKNKKLNLKPNESIKILFRDKSIGDSTETFYGINHNNQTIWDNSIEKSISSSNLKKGTHTTYVKNKVVDYYEFDYQEINGEMFKITKHLKKGKKNKKKEKNFIIDTVSVESEYYTERLLLSSGKLGWINCDRFYKNDAPKTNLIVEYKGAFTPNLVAVFKDINSVLPYSYQEGNKLIFKDIPVGMNIELIGMFKDVNNKNIQFAQKTIQTKLSSTETIIFEELTPQEVEKKIQFL